jgi:hypothetical protein
MWSTLDPRQAFFVQAPRGVFRDHLVAAGVVDRLDPGTRRLRHQRVVRRPDLEAPSAEINRC